MANIGTSTVAYATRQTTGQLVFIASDGSACVLWCDGTNQVIAYDDNTYASWTKVTHTTGLNMCLCGHFRAGTDNIDTVTGGTSNVRGNYRLLTKSGATWTVGASNALSGTTAIGVTAQGSPTSYGGQDAQGRHWLAVSGATNTLVTDYYSAANSPTTTGWTASGAVTQTADLFTPAADQIGNYFLKIYWNGTALQWHRVDNSGVSVGTWTTGATITNLTGSPNASSAVNFKAISATTGLLTYSTGSGIYAQLYDVAGNSWGAATQLSSNANDRHPVIATDGLGKAWVVWCSYAAANSFALVFKNYNGATWDAGATTLVASGTNIAYPNAGYGFGTLGVTYTQGTATPWTVGWITQAVGPYSRTIPTSAAFTGPGPLTLYGSATADATLPDACDVATVAGGVETSKVSSFSGTGNFGEVTSKGGAVTAVAAIPSTPTGHGWAYQPGAGTFRAMTWDAIITCASGANSGSWRLRFFKYDGATTYTPITTLTTSITSTAKTVYNFPASAASAMAFLSTDYLYWDLWYEDTFGVASETATCYIATTSAAGVANEMQIATAIFDPSGGGGTNTIPTSAAFLAEKSRTITSSAALLATMPERTIFTSASLAVGVTTLTRTITSSAALLATMPVRTIPTSAPLLATKTRTIGSSAALLATMPPRTVTSSAVLLLEKSRTLTTAASLLLEKSRTVGSSAAFLLEKSRTVSSTIALLAEKTRTVTSSAAFQAQLSRTITSSAAFSLTGGGVRTIPTSATFSLAVRTIPTSASLVLIQSRTIPSAASFSALGTLTRTVPSSAAFLQTSTRTVLSSAAFFLEKSRTIGSSAAFLLEKSRTVTTSASFSLLGTLTRTIPTSATFSLAIRTVPTSAVFSLTQTRTVPSSASLLATKTRTGATSASFLLEKSRAVPTSVPLLLEKSRTIGSSGAFSLGNARVIPSSAALSGVQARAIPTSIALIVTATRTVSTRATFSQPRVIPTAAVFISTRSCTIITVATLTSGSYVLVTTQAALQATQTRQVPSVMSVILIIPNIIIHVPSGKAPVEVQSGKGHVHIPSGNAALSID